jgi:hypothetical protein
VTQLVSTTATVGITPAVLSSTSVAELQKLVANIIAKCPELESRAAAASLILMSGKCRPLGAKRFEVNGTEADAYSVDLLGRTCSCKDFQHRAPEYEGDRYCKHLLGSMLLERLAQRTIKREVARQNRLGAYRPTQRPTRRRVQPMLTIA